MSLSDNLVGKEHIPIWINEILDRYKQKVGLIIPPICEKTLCRVIEEVKRINITLEADEKPSTFDKGLLIPIRGGFIIKYGTIDKNQKRFYAVKIRETICHELAHILFYDCTSLIPRVKVIPPEYLCHDIVRQLLLPDQIIKKNFSEKIKMDSNLIHIIKQLSKDFQVALMLTVRRLTEDLSLINDTMVTFWKYMPEKGTRYKGYQPDPKLSPELGKLLPKYWRDMVHIEAWDKVVSRVAIGELNNLPESLYVGGEKKKKGRIKNIPFRIKWELAGNRSNNLNFSWDNNVKPALRILSVEKFDLNILR